MNSRLIASIAVGTAVILGTSGCAMISTQATTIPYAAAEGVNVYASGPVQVRNAFIVASDDASAGNLVAALVNDTDEGHTLTITVGEGGDTIEEEVRVPARTVISLGSDDTEPLLLEGLEFVAGADIPVYFESGDSGSLVSVPILDGELAYLSPLVPES